MRKKDEEKTISDEESTVSSQPTPPASSKSRRRKKKKKQRPPATPTATDEPLVRQKELTLNVEQLSDEFYRAIVKELALQQKRIDALAQCQDEKTFTRRLFRNQHSATSANYAEAKAMAIKKTKGEKTFEDLGASSTDIKYTQHKAGGINVRVEVKSVTDSEMSSTNQAIINAEMQHKTRLQDEKAPCWHKTIIVLGEDNPWPAEKKSTLIRAMKRPEKLKRLALKRIALLQQGTIGPSSIQEGFNIDKYRDQLLSAARQIPTREPANEAPTNVSKPKKRRVPRRKTRSAPKNTPPTPTSPSDEETVTQDDSPYKPPRKTKPTNPVAITPVSKITQRTTSRLDALQGKQAAEISDDQLLRQMLVTEQVTIIFTGFDDFTLVLNRLENGQFSVHTKQEPKPEALRERRHWNEATAGRQHALFFHKQHGTTPLHVAVMNHNLRAVRTYATKYAHDLDIDGSLALHRAVANNDYDSTRVLLAAMATNKLNDKDRSSNTSLHIAASQNNIEIIQALIEHGANPKIKNADHQTCLDLITDTEVHKKVATLISEKIKKKL